jgi:DNA-binding MarR family transcriptional regulator
MSDSEPFDHTLKDLMEVLMRSSMRGFIRFAKERGLSMTQINTLVHLRHKGPCGVSDIGDELGVTSAAASQMLDRLVQQGLILRSEDQRDRRLKQIVLTDKGDFLLREGIDARQQWISQLSTALSPAEKEQVAAALNLMITKLVQAEGLSDDPKHCEHPARLKSMQ